MLPDIGLRLHRPPVEPTDGLLEVSRKVIEVNRKFQPEDTRFAVKEYPKDKEHRRLKLSTQLVRKIEAHVMTEGPEPGDMLFARRAATPPVSQIAMLSAWLKWLVGTVSATWPVV